jgi:steroid delta-isomerase-like uncharacterized protein
MSAARAGSYGRDTTMEPAMNTDKMKATARRYCEELFSKGKLEVVDEIYTSDYVNIDPMNPGGECRGPAAMKAMVSSYREAFPDLVFEVKAQWADGDTVVTRWTAVGTHRGPLMGIPATGRGGKPVEGVTISRFRGDRIAEDRAVWDALGLLRQLGVIPS